MEKSEVLIIGGGPAGCSAAAKLHQLGIESTIVERCTFPRFVIGESLLPRCMDHLEAIGALELVEQAGFQFKNGARFILDDKIADIDFSEKSTQGFDSTFQVKRTEFDTMIADHVQKMGIDIHFNAGVEAVELKEDTQITTYRKNGEQHQIESKFIIDASGYGRVLPRLLDLIEESSLDPKSAYFTHIKSEKLWNYIDEQKVNYIIGPLNQYVWIIPFADKSVSIGVVGDSSLFPDQAEESTFKKTLYMVPELVELLDTFEYVMPPKLIKGFSTSVSKYYGENYVMVGNTTEFLDPIFSSGVTIAMESGILGAKLAARQLKGETVDWKIEYEGYMKKGVAVFQNFVESWYTGDLIKIFFAENQTDSLKRYICSILAGYVWDEENPFVKKHQRGLQAMAKLVS